MLFYLDNWLSADPTAAGQDQRRSASTTPPAADRRAGINRRRIRRRASRRRAATASTRTTRASCWSCTRSASTAATRSRTSSRSRARSPAGPSTRVGPAASASRRRCTTAATKVVLGQTHQGRRRHRGRRAACSTSSPRTRRPRGTSRPSSRGGSSATSRPPALVDRAAARFRETDGDLREVVRDDRDVAGVLRRRGAPRQGQDAARVRRQRACAPRARTCATRGRCCSALQQLGHAALHVPAADRLRRHGRRLGVGRRARHAHELRNAPDRQLARHRAGPTAAAGAASVARSSSGS